MIKSLEVGGWVVLFYFDFISILIELNLISILFNLINLISYLIKIN